MLAASAAAFALATSAQPAPPPVEVGHVGLGSTLGALVTGPDGGAWVRIDRMLDELDRGRSSWRDAIGRATPDNRFRIAATKRTLIDSGVALGPDGQAWFTAGPFLDRSDAAGTVTNRELAQPLGDVSATGPDGTLWSVGEDTLFRVDAQGVVTSSPLPLPACEPHVYLREMKAASDGAVWIADSGCHRLIRIAPGAAPAAFTLGEYERPFAVAPDQVGGSWFVAEGDQPLVGHVDAGGTIRRWHPPARYGYPTGVAVGPDGTAYIAFGRCVLGRIDASGALTFGGAPIPVQRLAFDPSGGLWLASATRLVHAPTTNLSRGTCDDKPAKIKLAPALRGPVSLRALRRGIRITVREPATISATGDYGEDDHDWRLRIVRTKSGGSLVFRLPRSVIKRFARELAAGDKPEVSLYVEVYDRDGNISRAEQEALPVTR